MILAIDVGNTYLKYKAWVKGDVYASGKLAYAETGKLADLLGANVPEEIRLANVGSLIVEEQIRLMFPFSAFYVEKSQSECLGLRNGYERPDKLGVDRWLASIEAYHHSGKKACAVFDLGTALTMDVVDTLGHHLGGYIVPGLAMMRDALLRATERVRFESTGAGIKWEYGLNTCDAVESGTARLVLAWLDAEMTSFKLLHPTGAIYLTGGLSIVVKPFLHHEVVYHEDLVLDALLRISSS